MVGVVAVPLAGLVGKIATAIDYDVVPPTWAALARPQRHLLVEGQVLAPDERFGFKRFWSGDVFAALDRGEVLVVHSDDVVAFEGGVRSNTTFPLGEWGVTLEPHPTPGGALAMEFTAPYQGVFRVHVEATCARVDDCSLRSRWQKAVEPTGRPAPPALVRRDLAVHDGGVQGLAWSPDGRLLATAGTTHDAVLWDAVTGAAWATLHGHTDVIHAVAFAPDGQSVGTASSDDTARIWNVDGGTPIRKLVHAKAVEALAWRPDGQVLATGGKGGTLTLWDVGAGYVSGPIRKAHGDTLMALAWSPDGTLLASGGFDHRVVVWDVVADKQHARLDGKATVYSLAFVAHRLTLATAENGPGSLWEVGDQPWFRGPLVGNSRDAFSVSVTPDGALLANGSVDGTVRVWNADTGTLRFELAAGGEVNGVAFRPDGLALAAGLNDGRVVVWEATSGW